MFLLTLLLLFLLLLLLLWWWWWWWWKLMINTVFFLLVRGTRRFSLLRGKKSNKRGINLGHISGIHQTICYLWAGLSLHPLSLPPLFLSRLLSIFLSLSLFLLFLFSSFMVCIGTVASFPCWQHTSAPLFSPTSSALLVGDYDNLL